MLQRSIRQHVSSRTAASLLKLACHHTTNPHRQRSHVKSDDNDDEKAPLGPWHVCLCQPAVPSHTSAVQDYRRAGKSIVELYGIKKKTKASVCILDARGTAEADESSQTRLESWSCDRRYL